MMQKLITAIIPVYNGEKFIVKCINSIIKQTYPNFEILIINDGSTDNTIKEIEKIVDKRIKLFNKNNSGVSDTRNFGLSKATGDYVIFIDADDVIDATLFEKMINQMTEKKVNIIRYNGFVQDKSGKYKSIEFPVEDNLILSSKNDKEKIIELINSPMNSIRCYSPFLFMENKNIINFRTDLAYLEDKVFYLENLLNDKKVLFINQKLYYYNHNESSKTKKVSNFDRNVKEIIYSQNSIKQLVENKYHRLIDSATLSLLIYRFEYMCSIMDHSGFKKTLKKVLRDYEVKSLFMQKPIKVSKYVCLQHAILKKNMIIIFSAICYIKRRIKR